MTMSPGTGSTSGPVVHVMLMKVVSDNYDRLVREASDDVQRVCSKLAGLLRVEICGTDDRTHILILSEWTDNASWAHAQWDEEMQEAVVRRFTSAECVHTKLYRRIVHQDAVASTRGHEEIYGDENVPGHLE